MRPKLSFNPINPISGTIAIPSNAVGYMLEVYQSDGRNMLGRISYNNASRHIEFNKYKTGDKGYGYYPKYSQQIFFTVDHAGRLPTTLTTYSNGGHTQVYGWFILNKETRTLEKRTYLLENDFIKTPIGYLFDKILTFDGYDKKIMIPIEQMINLKENFCLLIVKKRHIKTIDYSRVYYLSTEKEKIIGKFFTLTVGTLTYQMLLCKSSNIRPFSTDTKTLTITTHYSEASTEINIVVKKLDSLKDIFLIIGDIIDFKLIISAIELRLEDFSEISEKNE